MSKKLRLLTFGSVNYASTAGGYAAVTKGLKPKKCHKTIEFRFEVIVLVLVNEKEILSLTKNLVFVFVNRKTLQTRVE